MPCQECGRLHSVVWYKLKGSPCCHLCWPMTRVGMVLLAAAKHAQAYCRVQLDSTLSERNNNNDYIIG